MKSIIIFASGQGTNADAIIRYFQPGQKVKIALIVCNNSRAGVLQLAEKHQIPSLLVDRNRFNSVAFAEKLKKYAPDLIVLAGFLWKIPQQILQVFPDNIINLHPALLPKYGGKGMYGIQVHQAVKNAGEKESGITIHKVNAEYDKGAILLQAHCRITDNDDPEDIAKRIHGLEHFYLPRTIDFLINREE